jgi:hypothetical protein
MRYVGLLAAILVVVTIGSDSRPKMLATALPPSGILEALPPTGKIKPAGSGFVAVLTLEKTAMEAVKAFADLQERYLGAMADTSFAVQELDLGAQGLGFMYRVVLGPPSSLSWAVGLCAKLKKAGHKGCWVDEY